jgi:hypothetical protein
MVYWNHSFYYCGCLVIGFSFSIANPCFEGPNEGAELVTDVGFNTPGLWTAGTGWVVSGGKATKTAGTGSLLSLTGSVLEPGITYVVRYTIDTVTAVACLCSIGNVDGIGRTTAGTYQENVKATATITAGGAGINFYGNATFSGVIDNFSVKRLV